MIDPAFTMKPVGTGSEWDLSITARCLTQDLKADRSSELEVLATRLPVVAAFVSKRATTPIGQEPVKGIKPPIYSLHLGEPGGGAWRAATWHDERSAVVWLLAYGVHRSGHRSDLYERLKTLGKAGVLLPTEEDYDELLRKRNESVVPALVREATALAAEARQASAIGLTCSARLARVVDVHVKIETQAGRSLVPAEEKIWLAIDTRGLEAGWLELIRSAILPLPPSHWQYTTSFPGRSPSRYELRFVVERAIDEGA